MKPIAKKYQTKDWYRNRRWRANDNSKDWKSQYPEGFKIRANLSYYPKKEARESANRAVRRYKGMLPAGCTYKKVCDVVWEVW